MRIFYLTLVLGSLMLLADSATITYTVYSDSNCNNVNYVMNITTGTCTNPPGSTTSGIVDVYGDLLISVHFPTTTCSGSGTKTMFGRGQCLQNVDKTSFSFQWTPDTSGSTVVYTVYNDPSCTNVNYSLSITTGVCANDPATGYSGVLSTKGDMIGDVYFSTANCGGIAQGEFGVVADVCEPDNGTTSHKFHIASSSSSTSSSTTGGGSTKSITYSVYNDAACTSLNYTISATEGTCTTNTHSGGSGVLFTVGDIVYDNYFKNAECKGRSQQVIWSRNTCQVNNVGKYFKFDYTPDANDYSANITYTEYSDTNCANYKLSVTAATGACTNNPDNNGYAAVIAGVSGSLITQVLYNKDCMGTGSVYYYALNTCQQTSQKSFKLTFGSSDSTTTSSMTSDTQIYGPFMLLTLVAALLNLIL